MNKFLAGLGTLLILGTNLLVSFAGQAAADEVNLIPNASMETVSGSAPQSWTSNSWGGAVASFSYLNSGHSGSRSLKTQVTAHSGGDAKWYFTPVNVQAGQNYVFSDYYQSSVATEVVVQYTDGSGANTYQWLGTAPASGSWAWFEHSFIVPAEVVKLSVFHVVANVGWLVLDDASLIAPSATPPPPPPGDEENLLANSSFETANGGLPTSWLRNAWGTNSPQFTYENSGRTGSHSVTTTLSQAASGDAKWYAEPVNVVPGKTYIYRDYYKANVPNRVVTAFIDSAGNYSYFEQPSTAASASWKLYETTFVAPASAAKVTVFHLIDSVGTLSIDDALLQVAVPPVADINVPNGSLEAGTATPTGWQNNRWGSNNASFQYVNNDGHTGVKSVKVTVSNYVDGDAKWFFTPIESLSPGSQYRFTAWYKGTALPHVVALYIKADGSEQYVGLPSPLTTSTTTWQKYTDTFTVPQGATAVSVFMYAAQNGWLQTDDYSITTYHPNGFSRPLLTLTFDDGHEDNAATALPLLNQYGFKTTQCYATSFIEGHSQDVIDGVMAFYDSGHEICSHTVTHPFLTSLNSSALQFELQHSKQYLESLIGTPVRNFASPYGDYNATVNNVIDNLYRSHRTVDEGFNSKDNFDIYRLRVQNILDTTPASQVEAWIEQAQADNAWLILVYHRVADNPGPYDTYRNIFAQHLAAIERTGITVKTYNQALDEVTAQL